ncbi:MAG: hypothetical protein Ct9H300mP28_36960 [Pseudomonadota bacterium]|nr:MAG: hypothetical protein Ct9H300mP28_36960 [Pseudomonadota bacterium]
MNKLIRRPDIWISFALFLFMIPAERLEFFHLWKTGSRETGTLSP